MYNPSTRSSIRQSDYRRSDLAESVSTRASKALRIAKTTAKLLRNELEHYDYSATDSTDYNGKIYSLCATSQGDTVGARTGNKITAKGLYLRLWMNSSLTTVSFTQSRVIVFIDKMQTGTPPVLTDLLSQAGTGYATVSHLNLTNAEMGRYKILLDKEFSNCVAGTTAHSLKKYIPLRNLDIHYIGTSGTDEGRNFIWIAILCNTVTTNLVPFIFSSRLSYTP